MTRRPPSITLKRSPRFCRALRPCFKGKKAAALGGSRSQEGQEAPFRPRAENGKTYDQFFEEVRAEGEHNELGDPLKADGVSLKDISGQSIEKEMSNVKRVKFLEYLQVSAFNLVPVHCELKGDMFYLSVRNLNGKEHGITCGPGNFS